MREIDRYLVTWGNGTFHEGFQLWRDAALWFTTVSQECDGDAKILYWHAGDQEYKEASMPQSITAYYAPIAQTRT